MALMIPPHIDPEGNPPGEERLFRELKNDPVTEDWIVLHSLDVASHSKRVSGEIDFVIIIPEMGVLCLEVKSHRAVESRNGEWFFGRRKEKKRSPFKQVSQTMHSLREAVVKKQPDLNHIVFWSAVTFPFVVFQASSPEWHPWQVIDQNRLKLKGIGNSAKAVLHNARNYLQQTSSAQWFRSNSKGPTKSECRQIADVLRPAFEFFESPGSRAGRREEEIRLYTDRQTRALDMMAANTQVAYLGAAGTGKTMLAIEATRRAIASGKSVLFLCYNKFLGTWIKEQFGDLPENVVISTFHQYLLKLVNYSDAIEDSPVFWERELPGKALELLLEADGQKQFDLIVIDEAQDLLKRSHLDIIDLMLDGGLKYGSILLFGDLDNQRIYNSGPKGSTELLEELLGPYSPGIPILSLADNCRNTPRIAHFIEKAVRLSPGYRDILRPDNVEHSDPQLSFFENSSEQEEKLISVLDALYEEGYRGEDIVVLSTLNASVASSIDTDPWKQRLRPYGDCENGYVRYCTIHAFKGLESPVVIITDLDKVDGPDERILFYVAMSRAQDSLIILGKKSVGVALMKIYNKN